MSLLLFRILTFLGHAAYLSIAGYLFFSYSAYTALLSLICMCIVYMHIIRLLSWIIDRDNFESKYWWMFHYIPAAFVIVVSTLTFVIVCVYNAMTRWAG